MNNRVLLKLGGASLQDESVISQVTETLRQYRRFGYQVVLVHGGGPAINAELTRRGISWSFIKGQRVTTPEMMETIEMVLCGQVNRKLVRALNAAGLPAVGMSGADGNTLLCQQESQQLGQVGVIKSINTQVVEGILAMPSNPIPVIAPLGVGFNGESYNINADWSASRLAAALNATQLVFLTDQNGILDAQKTLIQTVDTAGLQGLIDDETVTGGMLTKTLTILHALKNDVQTVRVLNAKESLKGLWSDDVGTQCRTASQDLAYA
jgi:acetylglutamate kinase